MKRCFLLLALLPQCTGCLYYAYPTISTTPELAAPTPDGSVHAFRVDVDRVERKDTPTATEYTLMRIPLDRRGHIPSQLELAPATGVWNPLGMGDVKEHERGQYTMLVRLYRPGYRTQEFKSWDKSRPVDWVEARDVLAQEAAIDDLLADPEPRPTQAVQLVGRSAMPKSTWWEQKDSKIPPLGLQPGITSPSHRAVLVFAASEYDRLANSPLVNAANMEVRERLRAKANWLRAFSEQVPPR